MSRTFSLLILGILITALLPTTLVYILGLAISIAGTFNGNTHGITPAFLYLTMLLIIPGYSLSCLWWLIFKFQNLSLGGLPKKIWAGLVVGMVLSLVFLFPLITGEFESPIPYMNIKDNIFSVHILGAPLIITLLLIIFIGLKNSRK